MTYRQALIQAGWSPGREIDTQPYQALLKANGYPIYPVVLNFFSEFGGLNIVIPHPRVGGATDEFHFDLMKALNGTPSERIDVYSKQIGTRLCPIGEASRGHEVLMMDETGRIFTGFDDIFHLIGRSPQEAIEALVSG